MSFDELQEILNKGRTVKDKKCMRFSETSYSRLVKISELTGETKSRVLNELLKDFLFNDIAELAFQIKSDYESHKSETRRQAMIYLDPEVAKALETKSRRMLLQPKMIREYVIDTFFEEMENSVSAVGK